MKILFYLLICCSVICYSQTIDNLDQEITVIEESQFPGIRHKSIINSHDTLLINIIEIDMRGGLYRICSVNGTDSLTGRETVSSMAERLSKEYNVIGGINADFFKIQTGGEVENNLVSNGIIIKALKGTDSDFSKEGKANYQFGVNEDNKFFIERFELDGRVIYKDGEYILNRINSVTDSGGITLYNSYQGKIKTDSLQTWKNSEILLKSLSSAGDSLLYLIHQDTSKDTSISEYHVLSFNNNSIEDAYKMMNKGDTIIVITRFLPDYGRIINLTGGWGKIVDKGKNIALNVDQEEGTFPRFSEARHPRSGIGFNDDSTKIYLLTVDGRQEKSRGVSLFEFAEIMLKEGVYSGLNLDGGGSTTLFFNGRIVNNPSDKSGERPVGNALLIIKNK
jgi:exopolysaccharide biosynthesis protein